MGTAMDMAMQSLKLNYALPLAVGLIWSHYAIAADVRLKPHFNVGLHQTDNVLLADSEQKSATVGTLTAGINAGIQGNRGELSFDYTGTQAHYSHDSSQNKLIHQLSASATKQLDRAAKWQASISAGIRNVPRSSVRNASQDLLLGDLVESRSAQVGLNYSNRSRGPIAVSFGTSANIQDSEDSLGDNNSYQASLRLGQGRRVKNYFWNFNYNFSRNNSAETDRRNSSSTMNYQAGAGNFFGLSPMLTLYSEEYRQRGSEFSPASKRVLSKAGPGLRYELSKRSYLQLTYELILEGPQEDSWGATAHWEPSRRTEFHLNYGVRYFGESLDVTLRHKNRRWTNTARYSETPESFNRLFFVDDDNIEDLALSRTLSWTSALAFKRGTFSVNLSARERGQSFDEIESANKNKTYSGGLSYSHKLMSNISVSGNLSYSKYSFGENQKDNYFSAKVSIDQPLFNSISLQYGAELNNRNSSDSNIAYKESRLFLTANKKF